ncbi:SLC13 family permease [Comamonas kerstersii]|uniref:DASS family sodium-coupled anion symporter n=1 Tax=Comamonas kerstersii TaxID=225992 RepID=A0A6A1R477_9BURK|nr:DASS family sodium-coupled anion symporter [Comamonas kerstersii]KAB0587374.1 DASS family sodium-coupled anion symporter [Comamonas kerstersii]
MQSAPTAPQATPAPAQLMPKIGLVAAFIVLLSIVFMPPIAGLPQAGQMMLGILAFAVIVWMTEALDYSVSALLIGSLMIGLLAISPVPGKEGADAVMMGTKAALPYALGGFSNSAVVLVAAACFIAAAMTATRLDQRIALQVLSYVPARANHVVMGAILVGFLLSFIVPSATARVACLMPIMLGFLTAFGADRRSKFAALVVITAAQTASVWNVGIKTAAAQNMVAIGFIERQFGETITWGEWFVAGAPFSACLTVLLYFIMTRMLKPEMDHIAGGREAVRQQLQALGKMTANQWKLLVITLVLLGFWATEGVLHKVDTTSSTIVAVTLMLMPRIGIMSWKESQKGFPWGTVVLFAVGIAMGSALLKTQAAPWLAKQIVENLGLVNASAFAILMLLSMFLIVIHLGFASATALASTMIPIVISVLQVVETPGINAIGITMLLQFVVSFGFILPVNSPQGMLAYGTDTFTIKQYVKTGFVITIAATVLLVIFALTYWPMMGYMTLK